MADTRASRRHRAFVISCGRAGSTALAHFVHSLEPQFTVTHEPPFWLALRMAGVRLATGTSTARSASRVLQLLRAREARRRRGAYVETTPALWGLTPVVPQAFPGCTLVHIVRSPHDYVASAFRFRSHRGYKGWLLNTLPYLYPKPEYLGSTVRWRDMSSVERSAWFWGFVNTYIDDAMQQLAVPCFQFRFEDLFSESPRQTQLTRLAEALGICDQDGLREALRGTRINASTNQADESSDAVAADVESAIQRWASEAATRFGYPIAHQA